jgi:hypothetical protein
MPKGGAREGAGRKTLPEEERTRPVTLHLKDETRRMLRAYCMHGNYTHDQALDKLLMYVDAALLVGYDPHHDPA